MSTAIAKQVEQVPAPASSGIEIAPLIERIMTDPSIPIDRVEQAFSFYQKVQADQARKEFASAFALMQPELPAVERKGTGHNNRKYARWEDIADAVMPVLAKHGFGLRFNISDAENKICVTCVLSHRAGHSEETSCTFPFDKSGGKNEIQSVGSAQTYGQRYTATAILGIAARGQDDDGNAAGGNGLISEEQVSELKTLIGETNADLGWICERYSIEDLADMNQRQFTEAKAGLLARKRKLVRS